MLNIKSFRLEIKMTRNLNLIAVYLVFSLIICFLGCTKKDKNSKLAGTYYKLGVLELEEGAKEDKTYKTALEHINKAIELYNKPEYLALKATLLFKLDKEKECFDFFTKALEAKPEPKIKMDILNNKACLLAQIGLKNNQQQKVKQAFEIWSALEDDMDYLTPEVALVNQGNVYFVQKNYELAKDKFKQAIQIAPNYVDARYYLAIAAYEAQDLQLAKNEISTVLYLEPDHQGAKEMQNILQK